MKAWVFALTLFVIPLAAQGTPDAAATTASKIPLDVLFIGAPNSERSREFEKFLGATFRSVRSVSLGERPPEDASFDVAVLDWSQEESDGSFSPLFLRDAWTIPTVLIGSAGLNLSSVWKLRGGWG